MSKARDIQRKIDRTTEARRRAWSESNPTESKHLTDRLEELYCELRLARARSQNGSPDSIVKRARVERELDKLAK